MSPDLGAAIAGLPCDAPMSDGLTGNLRVLAHDALADPARGDHRETDHDPHRPLLVVARIFEGGMDVVDTSDPTAPRILTVWNADDKDAALDVKFTSDGQSLVMAGDKSLRVVDMRNASAPRLESTFKLAEPTAHMITVFRVGESDYVAASKGEGSDLSIFQVKGEPGARTLERIATPKLTPLSALPMRPDPIRTHDTWFEVDPATKVPILWVANVFYNTLALDVTDPAHPKTIADFGHPDLYQGYSHSIRVAHVDGKRLVVVGTEYGMGALKVWDATDLAAPKLVATWSLQTNPPHNFQVIGSRAYVTYFEHGFYIVDLSKATSGQLPLLAHLPPTGKYVGAPREPGNFVSSYFGPVDILVKDGVLWVDEESEGLTALAYGCLTPGDANATAWG